MERVTDRDLDHLRALAIRMGGLAQAILAKALSAVWNCDPELAAQVKVDDIEIDRLDVEIDDAIMRLLALRAPVARDLRSVLATKSLAIDLERVGDLARNIADRAVRLRQYAPLEIPPALRDLADDSQRLLRFSLDSYAAIDPELARKVIRGDDRVDAGEAQIQRDSMENIAAHPEAAEREVSYIFIASSLERVGDHATNIAEDVILVAEAVNLKHAEKLGA
ncbi:MAG: phosphate signaling complex protein PhoU [Deltaproteobacteria bacterium]|nr:phosphate signaling complex protein PhoU [Deltaproteobacteria bacterium]